MIREQVTPRSETMRKVRHHTIETKQETSQVISQEKKISLSLSKQINFPKNPNGTNFRNVSILKVLK